MCLDCFRAEKEVFSDLAIRPAIDDEPRYLPLALCQRLDTDCIGLAGLGATMDVVAELSQFVLRLVAIANRAASVEFRGRLL